jgi:hypothetical protein
LDGVEVAIDVELEKHHRMIRWAAGRLRIDACETEVGQIEAVDEHVDHADRIVLVDPVLEALRKQRRLIPVGALHEPLHDASRESREES